MRNQYYFINHKPRFELRQKLCVVAIILFCFSVTTFAQEENWMPDPELRQAVREHLNLPQGTPLTTFHLRELTDLIVLSSNISNLQGLEHAKNLHFLHLSRSKIGDLAPLKNLVSLTVLKVYNNQISNITPLANLINLEELDLSANQISNIKPLTRLANLRILHLANNRIEDISPLVALTQLREVGVSNNWIVDFSPFAALSNIEILYSDNNPGSVVLECELPKPSVIQRIQDRTYPSVFGSWVSIPNRPSILSVSPDHERHEAIAYFDLYFCCPETLLLRFEDTSAGVHLIGDFQKAKERRDALLAFNPNAILLVPVRYYSGVRPDAYPEDWSLWLRDENGNRIIDIWGEALVDFTLPETQKWAIDQAKAIAACGLFDGIFLDHWNEDLRLRELRTREEEHVARDKILQGIRAAVDDDFLILVNANESKIPRWAEYVNGTFIETFPLLEIPWGDLTHLSQHKPLVSQHKPLGYTRVDISEIEQTLIWAETHFREPRINNLQGFDLDAEPPDSPRNQQWMRIFTTMSLTLSDGYVQYQNSSHEEVYWYDFWDADLGQPIGEKGQFYKNRDGLYIREYTNGWAVYNRSGKAQRIQLSEQGSGVSSGVTGVQHTIPDLDGEIYLKRETNPADINNDGIVNILDLVAVANAFGKQQPDINGDGVVNILDLVAVANAF